MQIKASIKNFRSTPRKARLIADFVRGKTVTNAMLELKFLNKKSAEGFIKLISSAVSNAENNKEVNKENLFIQSVTVDDGKALKRQRAGSNGRSLPFKRRLSHVNIILAETENK